MTQSTRTSRLRRAVSITVAGVLGAGAFVAGAAPAQAAPGDPFDEADPAVFVAQNRGTPTTRLYKALTDGEGNYVFQAEGPTSPFQYNAIGYNPADNYVYGINLTAGGGVPANSLIRIGQDGVINRVGGRTYGNGSAIAGFGGDGYFYVITGSDAAPNSRLLRIDATTGVVTSNIALSQTLAAAGAGADITFKDGFFWALGANRIVRLNPNNGDVRGWALPGARNANAGAAWTYGNGNLGFSQNSTGNVVQVSVENAGAANPTFRVVANTSGPASGGNDGTSSPGLPTDFAIEKTGPDTFIAGDTITYELTVTNNGPGNSSGWVVDDVLPAGLSNVAVDRSSCTVDSGTVSCPGGRLVAGESITISVTATAPNGTECLTNTASVVSNEEDPDLSNNEDSVESCPEALTIDKSSSTTGGTNDGDAVITYTVTATNDTGIDYTDTNPAVVVDDLSGVLDDADLASPPTADREPAPTYDEPLVAWSGPLPAGESVTITYSVLVKNLDETGDGNIHNTAWVPNDPDNPTPPACDTDDGIDPVTGEPCDTDTIVIEEIPVADPAITAMAALLGLGLAAATWRHRRHRAATSAG